MLQFIGFTKALAAVAGIGIIPCGLLAVARSVVSPSLSVSAAIASPPAVATYAPRATPAYPGDTMEVSLQETLDRLGYTVNVPAVYGGHTLARWNDYRQSSSDDALPASYFHSLKTAQFTKVSEQGMTAGNLDFGIVDAQGNARMLLQPDHNQNTYWISAKEGDKSSGNIGEGARFYLNDTTQMLQMGTLFSAPQDNRDNTPHLLALPARVGGQWVDEGSNQGHWEGGKDTGGVLLCWEDWQDYDYQDMVILAENVAPEGSAQPQKDNSVQPKYQNDTNSREDSAMN